MSHYIVKTEILKTSDAITDSYFMVAVCKCLDNCLYPRRLSAADPGVVRIMRSWSFSLDALDCADICDSILAEADAMAAFLNEAEGKRPSSPDPA